TLFRSRRPPAAPPTPAPAAPPTPTPAPATPPVHPSTRPPALSHTLFFRTLNNFKEQLQTLTQPAPRECSSAALSFQLPPLLQPASHRAAFEQDGTPCARQARPQKVLNSE